MREKEETHGTHRQDTGNATLMLVMEVAERHEHYCDRAGAGAGAGAVSTTVPPNKSTGVRL